VIPGNLGAIPNSRALARQPFEDFGALGGAQLHRGFQHLIFGEDRHNVLLSFYLYRRGVTR